MLAVVPFTYTFFGDREIRENQKSKEKAVKYYIIESRKFLQPNVHIFFDFLVKL